jgi:hypothetical protein
MNKGIVLAWIVGESIVIYRGAFKQKRPPFPSELLLSSLVFMTLGAVSEKKELAPLATLTAWGFVIAAYLRLVDPVSAEFKPGYNSEQAAAKINQANAA